MSYPRRRFDVRSNPWTPAGKTFFFPVKAVNVVFRGKFRDLLNSLSLEASYSSQVKPLPG